ncbi:MAG: GHMP kinase [Bacteroidetes bacterium]|nr:MAG: GHMP kinase [Bacteroidota bacterium]
MKQYYSNGKLLLTAEYMVLDGAKALALPTKFGQDLLVEKISLPKLIWKSFDENNNTWFEAEFDLNGFEIIKPDNDLLATKTLQKILKEAFKLSSKENREDFLPTENGIKINTNLTFPRNWGLGTSSTLINNIAKWLKVSSFELLKNSFGGSGYDIACAENNTPILFQLNNEKPIIESIEFNPSFKEQLYFVHLNKKQNSREGIKKYRNFSGSIHEISDEISVLTELFLTAKDIKTFESAMLQHEGIISNVIKEKPIQKALFSNYFGQTKSLGAWGGDFILATGNKKTPAYFKSKGFHTVIAYKDMIL